MTPYRCIVSDELLDRFNALSKRERRTLLDAIKTVATHAPLPGELFGRDSDFRPIYRKRFFRWQIWFWIDGPVNEVRIVDFERD